MSQHQQHPRPLGPAGQAPLRRQEQLARRRAAAFTRWMRLQGYSISDAAARLSLLPRTLAAWRRQARAPVARGRPQHVADPVTRAAVNAAIDELGPTVGVPLLRKMFPDVTRSELTTQLRSARQSMRDEYRQSLHQLQWHGVGRVWVIDYTEPLYPIDERFRWCLVVRDLASNHQLLALPVDRDTAVITACALRLLFWRFGPPLVIKADNGSHFTAVEVHDLLDQWQVIPLHSPPCMPRYNGAVEAGIGALNTRLFHHAIRHGRFDAPSCDDVEEARLQANACSRPWGESGPSPDDVWQSHTPATPEERKIFRATLVDTRLKVQSERGPNGPRTLGRDFRATVERIAVRRTLQTLGYLVIQKAGFSPPIKSSSCRKIS